MSRWSMDKQDRVCMHDQFTHSQLSKLFPADTVNWVRHHCVNIILWQLFASVAVKN